MSPARDVGAGRAPARTDRAEPVGSVLGDLIRSRPWAEGMALGRLGRAWPQVVGERLAAECVPARIQGSVLIVRASSAPWAAQIRFLSEEVARKANQMLGREALRTVKVVVEGGG